MTPIRSLLLILMLLLAAALIGCASQPGQAAAAVETTRVEMPPSYRFDPTVIRVRAGTTITWHNSDNFTHSVLFPQEDFPLLTMKPGEAGSLTFDQPGEYAYICTYHAHNMKGKVIVIAP